MPPDERGWIKVRQAMFNADYQRVAVAIVGALAFTAVSVGAAVGPARIVETSPVVAQMSATGQDHV